MGNPPRIGLIKGHVISFLKKGFPPFLNDSSSGLHFSVIMASHVDNFLMNCLEEAARRKIYFSVLSGIKLGKVDLDESSDVDILCRSQTDLENISVIISEIAQHDYLISNVIKRQLPHNVQFILTCSNDIIMIDLMTSIRYENILLISGDDYFELAKNEIDASALSRFLKDKANFKKNWPSLPDEIYSLRRERVGFATRTLYYLHKIGRNLRSFIQKPSGCFVVILGPDGSGKSSVISALRQRFCGARSLIPTYSFHWRPTIGNQRIRHVDAPHSLPPRGTAFSIVKMLYLLVTFYIGYIARVFRWRHRGGVVLADRYFHDILCDPKRYRFAGPFSLARLTANLLPQPDLWIYLDAPADVLRSRKAEVSLEESMRVRSAYKDFIETRPNAQAIDSSRQLAEVVAEVQNAILAHLARRRQTPLVSLTECSSKVKRSLPDSHFHEE
jgi:thymidylate kinase